MLRAAPSTPAAHERKPSESKNSPKPNFVVKQIINIGERLPQASRKTILLLLRVGQVLGAIAVLARRQWI